jgi:Dolichyl-phosphate-mannose-protein mannosyltransferase
MPTESVTDEEDRGGRVIVAGVAAAAFLLHFATARVYGFFIDELYFLACGEHLAWGYVDFPPLTAFQAWLTRHLFGDSPYSVRLFPSLAAAGLVLLSGALARRMGGGRAAQALAAVAVALAPAYLFFCSYLSMNSVEPLFWMGCALIVVRIVDTQDPRLWLWFGLVSGVGLLNKHTMALFAFGLVCGLLLTRERKLLFNRWLVLGGVIALALVLPNLVWNVRHAFPQLELLANIRRSGRDVPVGFLSFWRFELLLLQPVAAPLWALGLGGLLAAAPLERYRALGWAYLVALGILFWTTPGSHKTYYIAPAYPMLLAAGAVLLERWLRRPRLRWALPAYLGLLAVTGALLAPIALPILPPAVYLRYTRALGVAQPRLENRATNAMPQLFADRFGWPEMAEAVANVYNALPPAERERTGIFANDFGQGGAIDFYGPKLGLPKAIGGHLTYWYWGPRQYTGDSLIVLGDDRETLEQKFDDVEAKAEVGHRYAMRQEHFTVFLCRHPKGFTLQSAWPQLKNWN